MPLLSELLAHLEAETELPGDLEITGLASLSRAQPGHLSFLGAKAADTALLTCQASAVLVPADHPATGSPVIRVADPRRAFTQLMALFVKPEALPEGVHDSAVVAPDATLAADVRVGPHCVIGNGATLGEGTVLMANVTVGAGAVIGRGCTLRAGACIEWGCVLGNGVVVHPNAVVGSEGFGFLPGEGGIEKQPQMGIVRIGNDVEIGACTTIDRATIPGEATTIGDGSKLDNLVQIAHNCHVGRHCVIASQTGLSGSVTIGDGCMLGGQTGVRDHVNIGGGVRLGGRAGVISDVPDGASWSGYPAQDHRSAMRDEAALRGLPRLRARLREIERRIAELEAETESKSD